MLSISSGAFGPATMHGLNTYALVLEAPSITDSSCSTSAFWAE